MYALMIITTVHCLLLLFDVTRY